MQVGCLADCKRNWSLIQSIRDIREADYYVHESNKQHTDVPATANAAQTAADCDAAARLDEREAELEAREALIAEREAARHDVRGMWSFPQGWEEQIPSEACRRRTGTYTRALRHSKVCITFRSTTQLSPSRTVFVVLASLKDSSRVGT